MNYCHNHLEKITQADSKKVQYVWDPVKLNEDTLIDQTLISKAFSYNDTGSLTMETNLLGVADNRVLNSNF